MIGLQHSPSYFMVSHFSIPERFLQRKGVHCEGIFVPFFSVVQKLACPIRDEEKATGTVFTVHSKRWDSDGGSGSGQAGLGEGL